MESTSIPPERIPDIARLAASLPRNWHRGAWKSVRQGLALVELKRGNGTALYDWQGVMVATYSSSGAICLIDIDLLELRPDLDWDGVCDPLKAEMQSHFQSAVQAVETIIGAPQFCGDRSREGFPGDLLRIPQDYAAVWELPEAIFSIRADSNGNDEAIPWMVSACLEPYDEEVLVHPLVSLSTEQPASEAFSYQGDWSRWHPARR